MYTWRNLRNGWQLVDGDYQSQLVCATTGVYNWWKLDEDQSMNCQRFCTGEWTIEVGNCVDYVDCVDCVDWSLCSFSRSASQKAVCRSSRKSQWRNVPGSHWSASPRSATVLTGYDLSCTENGKISDASGRNTIPGEVSKQNALARCFSKKGLCHIVCHFHVLEVLQSQSGVSSSDLLPEIEVLNWMVPRHIPS